MDLNIRSQTMQAENQSWLGSAHGTQNGDGVTLDGATLGAVFATGVVPSGLLVAKITANGRWGPYDITTPAADGRQLATNLGLLLCTVQLFSLAMGDLGTTFHNVNGSIIWHGEVIKANLPVQSGIGYPDAAAIAALPLIKFA